MLFHALETPLIASARRDAFIGTLIRFVPEHEKPLLFARDDLCALFPKKAVKKYFGRIRREIVIAMITGNYKREKPRPRPGLSFLGLSPPVESK